MLEFFRQGGQAGKISEKVHRKAVQMGPTLVVISALTQERAEALVNICHRSGERKKLEAYMAALHKMIASSKLSKHRSKLKQNLKRVRNHAVENAIRAAEAATAQRVRRNVRAEEVDLGWCMCVTQ